MPRRSCPRVAELLLAAVALPFACLADDRDPSAAAEDARPLQLEVYINEVAIHLIGSFVQLDDGRIAARRDELAELGIKAPESAGQNELIVIDDVQGLSYRYEEQNQRISFKLADQLRVTQTYDLRGTQNPFGPAEVSYGGVLNYDLFVASQTSSDASRFLFSNANAFLDGRFFGPYGTLSQSAMLGMTASDDLDGVRLDTTWSYSDPETLMTYRAGDLISGGLPWTRPIRIGGLQARRYFGLRPDLITFPLPSVSGSAAVPSALDVYVDGVLTHSLDVLPGPYQIDNVPVSAGEGTVRVVVRDAAGRQTETELPFYSAPELLKQGFYYFSVEAGFPRLRFGIASSDYVESPVGSASVVGGLFDWLSLEAHAEAGGGLLNGGLGTITRLGFAGVASIAGSVSTYAGGSGFQSYLAYDLRTKAFNIHASSLRTFGSYDDLGSATANASSPYAFNSGLAKALDLISVGVPFAFDSSQVEMSYLHQELSDGTKTSRITGSYSRPILDSASIYVSAFSDVDGNRDYGAFFGLSMQLGEARTDESPVWVSTGVDISQRGTQAILDAAKPVQPEADSFGWRLHVAEGKHPIRAATASYRSPFAEIGGSIQQNGRDIDLGLQASGAVAILGGGTFFSNRIDDAFAVVDAGAPGVHVLRENRVIGTTDAHGRLLIPSLESYNQNNISIDVRDLPINAGVPTVQRFVTPQARSGVFIDFGVKTNDDAAVVILRNSAGEFVPPGSVGRLEGGKEPFVVGYDGRTFVQGLQALNTVVIDASGGECRATFPFVADQDTQVVIGPLTCQ